MPDASPFEAKTRTEGYQKLVELDGPRPVGVRYRYDRIRQLRLKTVELIVETTPWIHPADQIDPAAIVGIRVAFAEADLQRQVKQAGGKWNRERRLWDIRYDQVVALKLTDRIEPSTMPNNGKVAHA